MINAVHVKHPSPLAHQITSIASGLIQRRMKPPVQLVIAAKKSFLTRLRYRGVLYLFHLALAVFGRLKNLKAKRLAADKKPTIIKHYPHLPSHEVRIFIPKTYRSGDKPLPLFIDIHGGGFCIGAPFVDDGDNLQLAHEHGLCVVSIPYRLGPGHPFPTPMFDIAAMITYVLADESLPVDKSRVAVGGYSAGGTLSLTATQLPVLKGRIKGIVAYYPATNNSLTLAQRLAKTTLPPSGKDMLERMIPMFEAGFIPPGTNKADPLLSPIFADRKDLPEKIFILGCELDLLCPEAQEMAENLAELEDGGRIQLKERNGWTKGNIRWELIEGAQHGFNQTSTGRGVEADLMRAKAVSMHAGVAEWLKREVYSS
jgi:acetyl esterase/lipase